MLQPINHYIWALLKENKSLASLIVWGEKHSIDKNDILKITLDFEQRFAEIEWECAKTPHDQFHLFTDPKVSKSRVAHLIQTGRPYEGLIWDIIEPLEV